MSRVRIPKSKLRAQLDESETIKANMTELLRELEDSAGNPEANGPVSGTADEPGAWRHREPRKTT